MAGKKLYYENVNVGDEITPFVVENLTRTDFVRYAGSSGDFNPIHHDQTFADTAGYPTVFAMGMLNAGLLSKCIADYVGRENLRKYKVRFATQVWPGDTVTCTGKVTKKDTENGDKIIEGDLQMTNQKGQVTIQGGFKAALPSRS
jgi:acyl dehydratase